MRSKSTCSTRLGIAELASYLHLFGPTYRDLATILACPSHLTLLQKRCDLCTTVTSHHVSLIRLELTHRQWDIFFEYPGVNQSIHLTTSQLFRVIGKRGVGLGLWMGYGGISSRPLQPQGGLDAPSTYPASAIAAKIERKASMFPICTSKTNRWSPAPPRHLHLYTIPAIPLLPIASVKGIRRSSLRSQTLEMIQRGFEGSYKTRGGEIHHTGYPAYRAPKCAIAPPPIIADGSCREKP
jgi:hypothetical protein